MGDSDQTTLRIDGSDGGGQFFRSALSFSVLTGRRVEVRNVRGARENPGLKPQHVAAAAALSAISGADTEGIERGSRNVTFDPGSVQPGRYAAEIETAGSVPLVIDAVLPLALVTPGTVRLRVTGGTDVKWSPPLSYLRRVKLPILRETGLVAAVDGSRRGFYPVGGGEVTLALGPSSLDVLALGEAGHPRGARVLATASSDLADADVADRLADAAAGQLDANIDGDGEWEVIERTASYVDTDSSGAVIVLVGEHSSKTEEERSFAGGGPAFEPAYRFGVGELGEPGVTSETVADRAVESFREAAGSTATVDTHLADQLLPFLAVGGGQYLAPRLSEHLESHLQLLGEFGAVIEWNEREDGTVVVSSAGSPPSEW